MEECSQSTKSATALNSVKLPTRAGHPVRSTIRPIKLESQASRNMRSITRGNFFNEMATVRKQNTPRTQKNNQSTIAETVDRYELYEAVVQNVEEQCSFIDYMFKVIRARNARSF
jgi:hypothetical protein